MGTLYTLETEMSSQVLNIDRIAGLILLAFCLAYGYETTLITNLPGDEYESFTSKTLPSLLSFFGSFLSFFLIVIAKPNYENNQKQSKHWLLLISFLILIALYAIGLTYLGFIAATGLFLFFGTYLLGERRKRLLFGVPFPFTLIFYFVLTQGLDIYLEPGYLLSTFRG
jgi:putative tricarboxylic transport membrane protein